MSWTHLFDPINASIQAAAGFGSSLYLVLKRDFGWSVVLTIFFVTQVTAFYVTIPLAMWRGWSMGTYGFIAFCIGAFGFLVWGAVFGFLEGFRADPLGVASRVWALWKGKSGGQP